MKFKSHSKILRDHYENNKNYYIRYNQNNNGLCYIYFSSNGLYDSDNIESFRDMISKNKYEWLNLSADIKPEKEIFIRDIWLSWYVKGINSDIDNIEKIAELLKYETKGYKTVLVGMSSGGYLANIISTLIPVELCFNFSGQFSLNNHNNHVNTNELLQKYKHKNELYYENYKILDKSNAPIIYLYPIGVDHDVVQANFAKDSTKVYTFGFNTKLHAKTMFYINYPKFISLDLEEIIYFHNKFKNKKINPFIFSIYISGLKDTIKYVLYKIKQKIRFLSKAN